MQGTVPPAARRLSATSAAPPTSIRDAVVARRRSRAAGRRLSRRAARSAAAIPPRLPGLGQVAPDATVEYHVACGSASTPESCTTSASAPTSGTCCGSWRASISQTEFVILCRPEDRDALAALGENFRPVPRRPATIRSRSSSMIPLALKREGVTLFHAPHYVLPPLVQCRSVVTIHDCIHLMFPQYLPNRLRAHVREVVDRAGGAARDAGHDGVGELEARHPALRRHAARQDRRHLQRLRRALRRSSRARRTSCACASAISCTTSSCCTPAT